MIFNPFENRLSRDVRNSLGHCFIKAIKTKKPHFFQEQASLCQIKGSCPSIKSYIDHRTAIFQKIFNKTSTFDPQQEDAYFSIAGILWNYELFFEFHEWMEIKWTSEHGNSKKVLQAMVLAAVIYEHLTYGRKKPAEKLALKAAALFEQHKTIIPKPFDAKLFINKLKSLDPAAPKFKISK